MLQRLQQINTDRRRYFRTVHLNVRRRSPHTPEGRRRLNARRSSIRFHRSRQLCSYTVLVLLSSLQEHRQIRFCDNRECTLRLCRYHLAANEGCLNSLRLRLAGMTVATFFLYSVCILTLVDSVDEPKK